MFLDGLAKYVSLSQPWTRVGDIVLHAVYLFFSCSGPKVRVAVCCSPYHLAPKFNSAGL